MSKVMKHSLWPVVLLVGMAVVLVPLDASANNNNDDDNKTDRFTARLDKNVKRVKTISILSDFTFSATPSGGGVTGTNLVLRTTIDLKRNILTVENITAGTPPVTEVRNKEQPAILSSPFPVFVLKPKNFFRAYVLSLQDGPGPNEVTIDARLQDGRPLPRIEAVVNTALNVIVSVNYLDGAGQPSVAEALSGFINVNGANLPTEYRRTVTGSSGFSSTTIVKYSDIVVKTNAKR